MLVLFDLTLYCQGAYRVHFSGPGSDFFKANPDRESLEVSSMRPTIGNADQLSRIHRPGARFGTHK